MYIGGLLTLGLSPLWISSFDPITAIGVGSVSLIPSGIDGITQMFGERESTNGLRAITGLILGFGVVILVYGLVFILFK
jgi:uncharacterized membrane protein